MVLNNSSTLSPRIFWLFRAGRGKEFLHQLLCNRTNVFRLRRKMWKIHTFSGEEKMWWLTFSAMQRISFFESRWMSRVLPIISRRVHDNSHGSGTINNLLRLSSKSRPRQGWMTKNHVGTARSEEKYNMLEENTRLRCSLHFRFCDTKSPSMSNYNRQGNSNSFFQ